MENKDYNPSPADTSNIKLSPELLALAEKLAKNVHDTWAIGRIKEGWVYGPSRNDDKKETPCLVPYEDLSEEEKAYDRNTALETLKLIVSMGYSLKSQEIK